MEITVLVRPTHVIRHPPKLLRQILNSIHWFSVDDFKIFIIRIEDYEMSSSTGESGTEGEDTDSTQEISGVGPNEQPPDLVDSDTTQELFVENESQGEETIK